VGAVDRARAYVASTGTDGRLFTAAYLLLLPLYLAPLYVTAPLFPGLDLPFHLSMADMLAKSGRADSPYAAFYQGGPALAPYGAHYLVLWLAARGGSGNPLYAGRAVRAVAAMLAIVVAMALWLTPAIVSLGRSLDFVPREPAPPGMQRFWVLHAAYTSLEMFKLAIGGVAAWWIVKSSSRGAHVRSARL